MDIRKIGYSRDNQENEPGVNCVAISIYDYTEKVVTAISISSPVMRFNEKEKFLHIELLKRSSGIVKEIRIWL
ncbi:MAG: IclR family transcriptional regulator domain-containing protein [Bacillota bacterium]